MRHARTAVAIHVMRKRSETALRVSKKSVQALYLSRHVQKLLPSSLSVQSPGMVILERSKTSYGTPLALRMLRLCNIETRNEEGGKESTTEDELE